MSNFRSRKSLALDFSSKIEDINKSLTRIKMRVRPGLGDSNGLQRKHYARGIKQR
jgi:hypothetical protein